MRLGNIAKMSAAALRKKYAECIADIVMCEFALADGDYSKCRKLKDRLKTSYDALGKINGELRRRGTEPLLLASVQSPSGGGETVAPPPKQRQLPRKTVAPAPKQSEPTGKTRLMDELAALRLVAEVVRQARSDANIRACKSISEQERQYRQRSARLWLTEFLCEGNE